MSLHYLVKLEILITQFAHVLQKGTPEFLPPELWPANSTNPVDNSTLEILQEKVYKTCVIDLELSNATDEWLSQ